MKKIYQIVNGIVLVVTVVINYLSNTGIFNGETMATISAKYQNLFTPAGYAFSIWGLIYLGLFGFVVYFGPLLKQTGEKEEVISKVGWWFSVSCLANCLWVITWLYDYTFVTIFLMLLLFVSLLQIIQNTRTIAFESNLKKLAFLKLPFHLYAGWISVALIADVAAYLTKIGWDGFGISATTWTLIMFVVALIIHLLMIWQCRMPAFGLVAAWALIAIAVANKGMNSVVYTAAMVVAIIVLLNLFSYCIRYRKQLLL
ncbi:hypothetical protein [Sphingobacterium sp. 2149]|uniref:hypothetical protein n=1 Tax=Sphingobacterium sp. 2149 TaxID=2817763 RepID=UPI001AE7B36B|nr:hypothetical protein [Sphingobacterium sp. 2149]MDR6736209.1 hypothetical protein [Sphingobacterium sp. 2149]